MRRRGRILGQEGGAVVVILSDRLTAQVEHPATRIRLEVVVKPVALADISDALIRSLLHVPDRLHAVLPTPVDADLAEWLASLVAGDAP